MTMTAPTDPHAALRTVIAELDRQGTQLRTPVRDAVNELRATIEPSLFDRPLSDPAVNRPGRAHRGDTEIAAAYAVWPRTGSVRLRVLTSIARAGTEGRTDQELEHRLDLARPSPGNRRGELVTGGWVRDSGLRRPTTSGNPAVVWVLTDSAQARLNMRNQPSDGDDQ